jgi:hypothetical protein
MQKWQYPGFTFLFLWMAFWCHGQQGILIHNNYRFFYDSIGKGYAHHPSVQPAQDWHRKRDSVQMDRPFSFSPLISFAFHNNLSGKSLHSNAIGGHVFSHKFEKWSGNLSIYHSFSSFSPATVHLIDSLGYLPRNGNAFNKTNGSYSWPDVRGNLWFKPFGFLTIGLGRDKHFLGNGYRSMLLSGNAGPYPYLATSLKIWHIQYFNLTARFNDYYVNASGTSEYRGKFATMHYISWNIAPWINLDLFETVVWRQNDSTLSNGLNLNYLNPVIFMRPIEYAQGSTDNVLIGLGLNINVTKNILAYSQFMIDEFTFSEFFKNEGYRDNKYAFQLGLKGYRRNHGKLGWLIEMNLARPFTYSHYTTLQNYGHQHQPLAHPLGANFIEGLVHLFYKKNRVYSSATCAYSQQGQDGSGQLHGQNIYQNYWDVEERHGHFLLDGTLMKGLQIRLNTGFVIKPEWDLVAELGYLGKQRFFRTGPSDHEHYIFISLKTLLYSEDRFE